MKKQIFLFGFLFSSSIVYAANDNSLLEDELSGFEEIEAPTEISLDINNIPKEKKYSINGYIKNKCMFGYKHHIVDNINYKNMTSLQLTSGLNYTYKFDNGFKFYSSFDAFYDFIYDLESSYREDIVDNYQKEFNIDELYIEGALTNNIDIKFGRQIVIWGKSDNIRVNDVLNPMDNRYPGLTDIENLRLPVGMLKLDYYTDNWDFSPIVIFENVINKDNTVYSEYFPVNLPLKDIKQPDNNIENIGLALSANSEFKGFDLSFYIANNIIDSRWHITDEYLNREYGRINMAGTAFNFVKGSFLLKTELAFFNNLEYSGTNNKKNRINSLIGFDYNGFNDTTITLEFSNQYILYYENNIYLKDNIEEKEYITSFRISNSFINDTFNTNFLINLYGDKLDKGGFARISGYYDLEDNLNVEAGIVDYIGSDNPNDKISLIKDNDKFYVNIKYSF